MAAVPEEAPSAAAKAFTDPTSAANVSEVAIINTDLNFIVKWESKVLESIATLSFRAVSDSVTSVVLDTNKLDIKKCSQINTDSSKTDLEYTFIPGSIEAFGQGLQITLKSALKTGDEVKIEIVYVTSPTADAIQWLQPSQTKGGKLPYLFTQCQAILARTMYPCQDTPGAKSPYTAQVTVEKQFTALMSALSDGSETSSDGSMMTYKFKQPVPTSSYLVALVVGDLESRDISERVRIWSEPSEVEAAAWEFAETEKYLRIAEELCGPYAWTRYDLVMLPPSFPYGGMENVNLTFVTPTLIAGDRSLANVVAHEIQHSWSGNLVSNVTWEHFWLNEGWTRFIEGKIVGIANGKEFELLSIANGHTALRESVDRYGDGPEQSYTQLYIQLKDVDPDDAFSSVPYEKGCNFLRYLENIVGGSDVFMKFARDYFQQYKYKSLDSFEFVEYFKSWFNDSANITVSEEVLNKINKEIDYKQWLTELGMPAILVPAESKLMTDVNELWSNKWSKFAEDSFECEADSSDVKDYFVDQFEMLLDMALEKVESLISEIKTTDEVSTDIDSSIVALKEKAFDRLVLNMQKHYSLDQSKNCEVLFRFSKLCLLCDTKQNEYFINLGISMLDSVGRMKYVRPLYRYLNMDPNRRKIAVDTFTRNQDKYHPICSKMVARDLGL